MIPFPHVVRLCVSCLCCTLPSNPHLFFLFFFPKTFTALSSPSPHYPIQNAPVCFGCALPVAGSVQPLPNDLTSIYDHTKAETQRRGTAGFGSALKMPRCTRDRCQSSPSLYLHRDSRCSNTNHGGGGVGGDKRGEMKSDSFLHWCGFSFFFTPPSRCVLYVLRHVPPL